MFFWQGDINWRHNLAGAPQLWLPVGILFLIGLIYCCRNCFYGLAEIRCKLRSRVEKLSSRKTPSPEGEEANGNWTIFRKRGDYNLRESKRLSKNNYGSSFLLLIWLAVMLLPTIVSAEGIPHALRSIVAVPAVMIIAAIGLEWFVQKFKNWLEKQQKLYPQSRAQLLRIKKELIAFLIIFLISIAGFNFNQYFFRWANNPYVYYAFAGNYAEIGNYLNKLPTQVPKYVIVNASGVDVYGIPMPAQTVMFLTKTWLPQWQNEKNLHYILPDKTNEISCAESCIITMLETDKWLRKELKQQIPGLIADPSPGFVMLKLKYE